MNGSEVWKDVEGFEGKYQISNFGRLKSLARVATWGKSGEEVVNYLRSKFMQKYF